MIVEQFGQGGLNTLMLTEIYIEALLVDEELADQVWEAWDALEIDDFVAACAWWIVAALNFANRTKDTRDMLFPP